MLQGMRKALFAALLRTLGAWLLATLPGAALCQVDLVEAVPKWAFSNSDDGTETSDAIWWEDGFASSHNLLGRDSGGCSYDTGFRFCLEGYDQGDTVTFARLRFASFGSEITSAVNLRIRGVLQESPTTFSQTERPSQKVPKTSFQVAWDIVDDWDPGGPLMPLYYSSPDIAPIINEILSLPNWGSGQEGKTLIITIDDESIPGELNHVRFDDFESSIDVTTPVVLEVYRSIYDTFLGKELLGRVTDDSATVNLYSLIDTDVYAEYGTSPGQYTHQTAIHANQPAETAMELVLENLVPDTRHYYRIVYRKAGQGAFQYGTERTFHTQRSSSSTFSFALIADEHVQQAHKLPQNVRMMNHFETTLGNIAAREPDFYMSLGDLTSMHIPYWRDATNLGDAVDRYLTTRSYLDRIGHSIPFFLVIGNHEAELGWRYLDPDDNLDLISAIARKELIPNPFPDAFFTGNTDVVPEYGLREDYFAWEWGAALFVVLDPFWYTTSKPDGAGGTGDGWDWTYGKEQYDWLHDTLDNSSAKWKFVFTHHLTSTIATRGGPRGGGPCHGRGGIEVVKYKVDGRPSFEWGGEDENGNYVFSQKRPGWSHGAIHDMLVAANVTIVFHGHDHFFGKQDLDGIVYQECPSPDTGYNYGFLSEGGYRYGVACPASGHVQVTVVGQDSVTVDYIRAYLPGDGVNGEVAYTYTIQ